MEKDPATISKWCTNKAQPSLETIKKIAPTIISKYGQWGEKWRKQ